MSLLGKKRSLTVPTPSLPVVRWALQHKDAKTPTRAHATDAGVDLAVCESYVLTPWSTTIMRTGVIAELPPGRYLQLYGRSGLASIGVIIHPGIIDAGYVGEICVITHNANSEDVLVAAGDRVCQALLMHVHDFISETVPMSAVQTATERGSAGLGSSGR